MTKAVISAMLASAALAVKSTDYYYTTYYYYSEPTYYTYYYSEPTSYTYYYTEPTYYTYYYSEPTYYTYYYTYTEPTTYSYSDSYSYSSTDSYSYSSADSYSYSSADSYSYSADTTTAVVEPEVVLPAEPEPVSETDDFDDLLEELMECKKVMTIEEIRHELEVCRQRTYEAELITLASKWEGYYAQWDENHDMVFETLFIGDTAAVVGEGTDGVGAFKLEGTRTGDDVVFEKRYHDIDHYHVVYTGELTVQDTVVNGTWQIWNGDVASDVSTESGAFQLTKQYVNAD